jgi:5-methylcytosine-specific restriction endonuclease McrA
MPSRAESKIVRALKLAVMHRDGNMCHDCKIEGIKFSDDGYQIPLEDSSVCVKKLDLHHIDNNPSNNSMSNLRLLCRSCNQKERVASNKQKHSSEHQSGVYIRESPTELVKRNVDYQEGTAPMKVNGQCEVEFRHWVEARLRSHARHQLLLEEVVNGGAERIGSSQATIQRYLDKMTSEEGILKEFKDEFKHKIICFRHVEQLDEDPMVYEELAWKNRWVSK